MPQNNRQIKLTIILFLTIILISQFFLISLAKTEVYFSLSDNPQKAIIKNINQAHAFISIAMYVFPSHAQEIITLRDSLYGGFNELKDILQLPELTNLDWREWKEEGIIINIE